MAPQIIDGGIPTASLVAHILISHLVDYLSYYRQQQINARFSEYFSPSWTTGGCASDFLTGLRLTAFCGPA